MRKKNSFLGDVFGSRSYSAKSGEWSDRPGFSRHSTARGKEVNKTYLGYKIYTSDDAWKTDLDSDSDFDTEQDVKEFIRAWNKKRKYNPNMLEELRAKFARNPNWQRSRTISKKGNIDKSFYTDKPFYYTVAGERYENYKDAFKIAKKLKEKILDQDGIVRKTFENNPIKSSGQFRLAEAVAHGYQTGTRMSKKVAEELLSKTPKGLRRRFARGNPLSKYYIRYLNKGSWYSIEIEAKTESAASVKLSKTYS